MDRLAALLAARGVKKVWLARELGIDPTLLSHYLSGRRPVPHDFYRRAARALRVRQDSIAPPPVAPIPGETKAAA